MLALNEPCARKFRVGEEPLRHYVVEGLAFNDGVHVSLSELRPDDQAHLPAVREEVGRTLRCVLKLGCRPVAHGSVVGDCP